METQKFHPHWFYCLQWGCNNLFCQECMYILLLIPALNSMVARITTNIDLCQKHSNGAPVNIVEQSLNESIYIYIHMDIYIGIYVYIYILCLGRNKMPRIYQVYEVKLKLKHPFPNVHKVYCFTNRLSSDIWSPKLYSPINLVTTQSAMAQKMNQPFHWWCNIAHDGTKAAPKYMKMILSLAPLETIYWNS